MKGYILALVALAALLFAVPCEAGGLGVGGCGLGGCNAGFNQSFSVNHNFNGFNNGLLLGNRLGFGGFSHSLTIRHRSGVGLGAGLLNRGGIRHRTTIRHRVR